MRTSVTGVQGKLYKYKLVAQHGTTLGEIATELERRVTDLEGEGWEIDPKVPSEHGDTLLFLLRVLRDGGMRGPTCIPMRRELTAQEYAEVAERKQEELGA